MMEELGKHLCKAPFSFLLRLFENNHVCIMSSCLAPGTVLGVKFFHPIPTGSPLLAFFLRPPWVTLSWGDSMRVVAYYQVPTC